MEELGIKNSGYNAFLNLMVDRYDNLWISTFEGVAKSNGENPHFEHLTLKDWPGSDEMGSIVRGVLQDQFGQVWMGVEDEGIFLFDTAGKPYKQLKLSGDRSGLNYNFIMEIMEDRKGRIWVGTFGGGLHRLIPKRDSNGKLISYSHKVYLPKDDSPTTPGLFYTYDIFEDREGTIWVAGFRNLIRIDEEKGEFIRYPIFVANEILETSSATLLVASDEGIYQFNKEADSLERIHVEGLPTYPAELFHTTRFESLYEDKEGMLWATSSKGLFRIEESGQFSLFNASDGLPSNKVENILQDEQGLFWISGDKGLSIFDGKQFRNFTQDHGILNFSFTSRAYHKPADGRFLFGGNEGIIRFDPMDINISTKHPALVITDFLLFNNSVPIGNSDEQSFNIPTHISYSDQLSLSYAEKAIAFKFASLNYKVPAYVKYAYQLEGFDEDWIYTPASERTATYTNLHPGTYRFKIKATNESEVWGEQLTSISIIVSPPWWRSTWAYIMYACLLACFIYGLIQYRTRKVREEMRLQAKIKEAKIEERDRVRAQSSRDFHDEAGNKITKISLYANLSKQKATDTDLVSYLDKIETNARELSAGMRDFIWVLDTQNDSLEHIIDRMVMSGKTIFEDSGIEFKSRLNQAHPKDFKLEIATKRNLLLIFKEAMHNCLKYANCHSVLFSQEFQEGVLSLTLMDDGLGFDKEKLVRINGLHNMRIRAEEIGAELLIESVPGLGTNVKLQIKLA